MSNVPSSKDDVIDSRDIIARIEELTEQQESHDEPHGEGDWAKAYPEDAAELAALKALADECEGYGDWEDGETLIARSYFQDYAQELAEDTGAVSPNATWPNNCIDWEKAADELETDYMAVDFDGNEYLMRA